MLVTLIKSKQVPQVTLRNYKKTPKDEEILSSFESESQQKFYERYRGQGMTPEQAEEKVWLAKNNEKSWPKSYSCNFLEAGAVSYEDVNQGIALLKKESMDTWMQTFVGKPVIIDHQDVSPQDFKNTAVGYITRVWFNPDDAWYWCEFLITDDAGHEAIKDGYSVSCSFDVVETMPGSEWHSIKCDEEITRGEGLHLALVTTPRYEDCRVLVNSKGKAVINAALRVGDEVIVYTGDDRGTKGKIDIMSGDTAKVRTSSGALFTYLVSDLRLAPGGRGNPNADRQYKDAKSNTTDFSIMSPLQIDKYMGALSDVGLQTIVDGEHDEEVKKIAQAHQGDRSKKKEETLMQQQDSQQHELKLKEKKNEVTEVVVTIDTSKKEGMDGDIELRPFESFTNTELEAKLRQLPSQMSIEFDTGKKQHMQEEAKAINAELERRKAMGDYKLTNNKEEQMFGLFAKKQDKASIQNDKIDATKVFVKVDDEMVSLSTLMNSVSSEFEMLQESDAVKINGKDVSIKDLVASFRKNGKKNEEEEKKKEDAKDKEEKKEDAKEEEEKKKEDAKEEEEKENKGKCSKCGNSLPNPQTDGVPEVAKKNKEEEEKDNSKNFHVDLKNAKEDVMLPMTGGVTGSAYTREDKANRGKTYFGSKKK